jgi:hypothetical protein
MEKEEEGLYGLGERKSDEGEHRHFDISVKFVDAPTELRVRPHELVVVVLEQALHYFGLHRERERFALFKESGIRLNTGETIEQAGIQPNENLLLRFEIFIIYNGVRKGFFVAPPELVGAILADAIKAFGISQAPHTFGLFTEGGVELDDKKNVTDSGIKPGEKLLLRPSAVRAG